MAANNDVVDNLASLAEGLKKSMKENEAAIATSEAAMAALRAKSPDPDDSALLDELERELEQILPPLNAFNDSDVGEEQGYSPAPEDNKKSEPEPMPAPSSSSVLGSTSEGDELIELELSEIVLEEDGDENDNILESLNDSNNDSDVEAEQSLNLAPKENKEAEQDETSEEISNTKIALAVIAGSFLVAGTVALFVFCPPAAAAAVFIGAKIGAATGLTAAAHAAIPLIVGAAKIAGGAIVSAAATAGSAITSTAGMAAHAAVPLSTTVAKTAGSAIAHTASGIGSTLTSAATTASNTITHAAGTVAHAAMPVTKVAKAVGDTMAQTASTAMQSTVGRLALTATAGIAATGAVRGMSSLLSTAAQKIQGLLKTDDANKQKSQDIEMTTLSSSSPTPASN